MTTSTQSTIDNFWDFDFYQPQPTQDSDLLKQLGFIPGLKELLMLRQVHALEHATVWVLSEMSENSAYRHSDRERRSTASPAVERQGTVDSKNHQDNENLGGMSTERGFYLYGQVNPNHLKQAVRQALQRFKAGEWNLAVHPRCGTNLSVTMMLTTGLALGAHFLFPRGPLEQFLGLVIATTAAAQIAPNLGLSTQKYITTAIPFNLELTNISKTQDFWGRSAYFVELEWRDLQ